MKLLIWVANVVPIAAENPTMPTKIRRYMIQTPRPRRTPHRSSLLTAGSIAKPRNRLINTMIKKPRRFRSMPVPT